MKPRYEISDPHDRFVGVHEEWDIYLDLGIKVIALNNGHVVQITPLKCENQGWEDSKPATEQKAIKIARAKAALLGIKQDC